MPHGDIVTLKAVGVLTGAAFLVWVCQLGWLAGRRRAPLQDSPPPPVPVTEVGEVEDGSWGGGSSPDERLKMILKMEEKREQDLRRLGMRVVAEGQQQEVFTEPDGKPPFSGSHPPVHDPTPLRRLGISKKYRRSSKPPTLEASAVVSAMKHAWKAHSTFAWGHDEVRPLTQTYHDWVKSGLGLTMIDSLDTLYLMNLTEEYEEAAEWARSRLNVTRDGDISVFEVTIRVLGGLLSAYTLSEDRTLLDKAVEVAEVLYPAFSKSETGIPYSLYNPVRNGTKYYPWTKEHAILSEVGTLQLEWRYLSWLTNNPKYDIAATKAFDAITTPHKKGMKDGLYPLFVSAENGNFASTLYGIGGMGDSHYEYLFKQWYMAGNKTSRHAPTYSRYKTLYEASLEGIRKWLIGRDGANVFVGQLRSTELRHKMDHLTCFFPGLLALTIMVNGGQGSKGSGPGWGNRYTLEGLAKEIMETCLNMYFTTPTGLGPEEALIMDGSIIPVTKFYLLRPETIESLFYLHRLTKNPKYRKAGWTIFQSIEQHCRHPTAGYTSLESVTASPPSRKNSMESFFTAETLKYFYLLFSDDEVLPLDEYLLNTEAHVFPVIPRPGPSVSKYAHHT